MVTLQVRCLECHFPFVGKVVTFLSPAKVPGELVGIVLYTSPPVRKQCPHGETISEPYKPAFHGSHLSCNMSHGGAATLWVFHLP